MERESFSLAMSSFKNIVCIDLMSKIAYKKDKDKFIQIDPKDISKNSFVISYISHKNILTSQVKLENSSTLTNEEIESQILQKVYLELGLSQDIDYKVTYLAANDDTCDTFTTSVDNIFEHTNRVHLSYIDCLTTPIELFKTIYYNKILPAKGMDCFIYFQDLDAFLLFFNDGKFYQCKSLSRYSLSNIYEKFNLFANSTISKEEFYLQISSGAINAYTQGLNEIFDELFLYVLDLINSMSHFSDFKINSIFIGSDLGNIKDLSLLTENKLNINAKDFDFFINDKKIPFMHVLMGLYAEFCINNPDKFINFSPLLRPLPFLKRKSALAIGGVVFGILINLIFCGYYIVCSIRSSYFIEDETSLLAQKHQEFIRLNTSINSIKDDLKKVISDELIIKNKLNKNQNIIDDLYDKKSNYIPRVKTIADLTNFINMNYITLKMLKFTNNSFELLLTAQNSVLITQLIDSLASTQRYEISVKNIAANKSGTNQNLYESLVIIHHKEAK